MTISNVCLTRKYIHRIITQMESVSFKDILDFNISDTSHHFKQIFMMHKFTTLAMDMNVYFNIITFWMPRINSLYENALYVAGLRTMVIYLVQRCFLNKNPKADCVRFYCILLYSALWQQPSDFKSCLTVSWGQGMDSLLFKHPWVKIHLLKYGLNRLG